MQKPSVALKPAIVSGYFVNEGGMGKKNYYQYLELIKANSGKTELLRVSGKIGGTKRKIKKTYNSSVIAKKDFEAILSHLQACGYQQTPEVDFCDDMRKTLLS